MSARWRSRARAPGPWEACPSQLAKLLPSLGFPSDGGSSPPSTRCYADPSRWGLPWPQNTDPSSPITPSAAPLGPLAWFAGFSRAAPRPQHGSLSLSLGNPGPSSGGLWAAHPWGLHFLISSKRALRAASSACPASPSFTLRPPSAQQGPYASAPRLYPALPPAPKPPAGVGFPRSQGQCSAPARLLRSQLPAPTTVTVRVYPRVASRSSHWGRHRPSGSHCALRVTTGALPSPHPARGSQRQLPRAPSSGTVLAHRRSQGAAAGMSEGGVGSCPVGLPQLLAWKPGGRGSSCGVKVYCGAWAWARQGQVLRLRPGALLASSARSAARGPVAGPAPCSPAPGGAGPALLRKGLVRA